MSSCNLFLQNYGNIAGKTAKLEKRGSPKALLVGSCCSNKHMTTAMFFLSHSRPVALTMDGQNLQ